MIGRAHGVALGLAGGAAVAMPLILLWPSSSAQPREARVLPPLSVPAEAPLAHVFDRPLFTSPAGDGAALPPDAPQLSGIVGRLGSDAVALVRTADGASRSLAIGDSVDGWRLESLSIDAALFARGGRQARVPLPNAEPEPAAQ